MPDRCEYEGCALPAEGYVEAQWSLVDFVRYEMCNDHLWDAYEQFCARTVDGEPVVEAGVHYYSPD